MGRGDSAEAFPLLRASLLSASLSMSTGRAGD
jgi:hypothetical protein